MVFLEAYWLVLKDFLPNAFESKEKSVEEKEQFGRRFKSNIGRKTKVLKTEESAKESKYLLLSALGIYAINKLAKDVLHSLINQGADFRSAEVLKEKLDPLKSFEWNTKTSKLSALVGMKGVSRAYELLISHLGQAITVNPGKQLNAHENV